MLFYVLKVWTRLNYNWRELNEKYYQTYCRRYFSVGRMCDLGPPPVIDTGSSEPGGSVNRKGNPTNLLGNAISVGHPLPSVELVDSSMKHVDLSKKKGKVLLLSIVPSIDTKVCEEQTRSG